MIRIDQIFRQWIDILARLLLAWRERRRASNSLRIVEEEGRWSIQRMGKEEASADTFAAGVELPVEIAREAERCFVVLQLAGDQVISRRMNVPARAGDLLAGIVRNQIERFSAWRVGQAAYGFDTEMSADGTTLDVRILITSRVLLERARSRLVDMGLRVDQVVALERAADQRVPIVLWSRLADLPDKITARIRLMLGGALVAVLCLTAIITSWAFMSAAAAESEGEEIAARIAVLQRQAQGPLSQKSIAALPSAERAWALKVSSPVAVIIIEALSRSLPDGSYITDLTLDGSTLRIAGLADDTPSLIAPLEKSGHLKDVHFSAPTTRSSDGGHFLFHIEASVEPHTKIDGG